jgi:small neutral amino acid transporter SnatA (MarC family)
LRAAHSGQRGFLNFLVLVCVALLIDLTYIFPPQLLALCGDIKIANWQSQMALLVEHVQWLPLSNAVMIAHVLLERGSVARRGVNVALMFASMFIMMEACRLLLQAMGWPWTAAWLACSMILSVVAYRMIRRPPYQGWPSGTTRPPNSDQSGEAALRPCATPMSIVTRLLGL